MKKIITLFTTLALLLSLLAIGAAAQEQTTVFVTIAVKGELVAAQAAVPVEDVDGDGTLTVNDALYIAHQNLYDGGAEAGYGYYTGDYGLSMSKLWGDESGSFGYYLNNASCMSLADTVKDGDRVTAFVYASADWSDVYSYFDVNRTVVDAGQSVTLTLTAAGYDENWAPITYPVEAATITVDGQATSFETDAEGKVTLTLEAGEHVISATHATMTLVPPVCTATVNAPATEETTKAPTTEAPTTQATTEEITEAGTTEAPSTEAPEESTGCKAIVGSAIGLFTLLGYTVCALIKRKEK
ncbi:MAG: hypothetical protein IJW70_00945 [Clostridia bacterium]|nr:hypothetical protein [Clostridia bacterium]